jgi:transcriptional regulator with XRE-family HTH domain
MAQDYRDFQVRINQACDNASHVPPKHAGRLVYLADRLHVSVEAVRKWLDGQSKPRRAKILEIAKLLGVDPNWLEVGVNGEITKARKDELNLNLTGATNTIIGFFTLSNLNCALPDELDPRADAVDFYSIIDRKQRAFVVSLAEKVNENTYSVNVRQGFERVTNLIFVPTGDFTFDLLTVEIIVVEKNRVPDGSNWKIAITKDGGVYRVGEHILRTVLNIEDLS